MEIRRKNEYIILRDLEVYQLARELSKLSWQIYQAMNWQTKKTIGDQFISSIDSIGANIAEGYGRFHYLDQIRFYYNARGSLFESCTHWLELLRERKFIKEEIYNQIKSISEKLSLKLNNFIHSTYESKRKQ